METPTKPKVSVQGRFLWYELQTTSVEGAKAFYSKIMNWSAERSPIPDMEYTLFSAGGVPVAGMMELPEHLRAAKVPPHWMGYVGCDDLDETVARAKKLGASVHFGPHDIPNIGRFAVIGDPQGAGITLYTPAMDPSPDQEPPLGWVSWHELTTTDYKAAWKFYSELFDWEPMGEMDMGPQGIYFMYGMNGRMLGGMMNKTADMPFPPYWGYYVRVKDCKEAAKMTEASGGKLLYGPMETPNEGGFVAAAMDPQGAMFALHSKP